MVLHKHNTQLDVSSSVHRFLQSLGEVTKPQVKMLDGTLRAAMHTLPPQGKLILIQMADTDPHEEEHTWPYRRPLTSWTFHQTGKETWERCFFRRKNPFLFFILENKLRFLIWDSFHLKCRRCCPSNLHIFFCHLSAKILQLGQTDSWFGCGVSESFINVMCQCSS